MSIPTANAARNTTGESETPPVASRTAKKNRPNPSERKAHPPKSFYMSPDVALQPISRRIPAGTDIVREGDHVPPYLLVLDGWAAPYKRLSDGRRQFFDILIGPDGLRGLRSTHDADASLSVVALTTCRVWQGVLDDLRLLVGTRGLPDFGTCQDFFVSQYQRTLNHMTVLGHTRAPVRVAYCLFELWKRQLGDDATAGQSCPLPIKQNDIGDAMGLTGVHVCRTMSTFRKLGIVRVENGQMTVLRPHDLAEIAGVDGGQNLG